MEYFEILAECSIAFGGFSALLAVLQGSTGVRGAMRAWHTVTTGMGAFLLCLVALLVDGLDLAEASRWRIASGVGFAWVSFTTGSLIYLDLRLTGAGEARQFHGLLYLAYFVMACALLTLGANLVGWPTAPNHWTYGLAITLYLLSGITAFLPSFWLNVRAQLKDRAD